MLVAGEDAEPFVSLDQTSQILDTALEETGPRTDRQTMIEGKLDSRTGESAVEAIQNQVGDSKDTFV